MHLIRTARFAALAVVIASTAGLLPATGPAEAAPAYPESEHVYFGCHISTVAYLARFSAEHPAERGRPAVLMMDNADGVRRPHTIALVTWRGMWWGRDEYFGTFPLNLPADAKVAGHRLEARATTALAKAAGRRDRTEGYRRPPVARGSLNREELAREAAAATRILPHAATTFWVSEGRHEYPLVFFRPDERTIAVYDPHSGTCVAETETRDATRIVAAVAARLGCRAASLRTELPAGTAVVAATP